MGKAWGGLILWALLDGAASGATLFTDLGAPVALSGHVLPALSDARVARSLVPRSADTAADAVTLTVVLRRNDPAGFERYLAEVYDPRGPRYRQFLSAQALSDRFGPSPDDFAAVRAFFTQRGFEFVEGSANRLTLAVRAPRATVEGALAIALDDYTLGERRFRANAQEPTLPAAIAARVQAIVGLADLARPRPVISWFKEQPCKEQGDTDGYVTQNNMSGDPYKACTDAVDKCAPKQQLTAAETSDAKKVCIKFLPKPPTPVQAAQPRALPTGAPPWKDATGAGQRVGLVQFDTFVPSDVADYLELFGMPDETLANLSQVHVNGGATLGPDQSEVLLDVNAVLMGAPDAKVVVYDAPFTGGGSFQGLFNRAIADGMTIISNSWTYCEDQTTLADVQSIDAILATAAAAGISVFNASGDSGSTCLDGSPNTIGVPAGSPHATAVGGTSLKTGPTAVYESETWWNGVAATPPTGQGGFGVSRFFARPLYQDGITASPMRSIPDIAFSADPANGVILCQASLGGCPLNLSFGGTSIAAPAIAAAAAILNQAAGHNLGNLNLALYPLANTPAFHTPASMGSDFAHVGLGSPNFNKLYLALTQQTVGAVSAAQSKVAVVSSLVAADGTSSTAVVVRLRDADGNAVSGKTVALAANPSGNVVITPASGVSSVANGAVVFHVRNLTVQAVTFTATDTTDNVIVTEQGKVTFGVPMAAGGGIGASPSPVVNDGVATTTITITLQDAQNRPTPGKVVALSQGAGHSIVTAPVPAVTDANGQIRFTATNTFAESVTYTAVDVTDGNLPIPGNATVVFGGQGTFTCVGQPPPTAAAGYTLTPFATGYVSSTLFFGNVNWGCRGVQNPAFAPDGSVLTANFVDGSLFRMTPQGGVADSGAKIATLGPSLFNPVVGKDGKVYAARGATTGNFFTGAIYEIDAVTGAIVRTVLSGLTCPTALAVDPLSGDLFFDDSCFGAGADNPSLWRVTNPAGASPALTVYTTLPATPAAWIAFAPDGTLYVPQSVSSNAPMLRIAGTDQPSPPAVSTVPGLTSLYWVTVAEALPGGAAKSLIVLNGTTFRLADITTNPPTFTDLVDNGPGSGMVGPDGCLYIGGLDTVYKLAPASGGCGFAATSPAPRLRLTPETAALPQGEAQTLVAQFENLAVPAQTPVFFAIGDANLQLLMGRTDAQGRATVTYQGVRTGADQVDARATIGDATLRSNGARVTWTAGRHATLLTLNPAPGAGTLGKALTLRAALADISLSPSAAIAGVTIAFTLGAQGCAGITDAQGTASCTLVPSTAGSQALVATFAGSASYTAATDRGTVSILAATSSLAAAPPALDFGNVNVGATSPTASVVITNAGTLPYTIASLATSGAQAGDFARLAGANACATGATLAAGGGTCTLYVAFTPGAAGGRAATLVVSDGNAALDLPIALTGTGIGVTPPALTATPGALDFGPQVVFTSSASRGVTFTNTGSSPFVVSTLVVAGAQADEFTQNKGTGACFAGGAIAAGASCTVYLSFRPLAVGARAAVVSVTGVGVRGSVDVPLTGTGMPAGGSEVSVTPASLVFGDQAVGRASAPRTVVLTNVGANVFVISDLPISGAQASDFALVAGAGACAAGTRLAPGGGTCTLYVAFTPSAAGARTAMLAVNAPGQSLAVSLAGTGAAGPIARVTAAPATLVFGDQAVGTTSAARTVVLTNVSATAVAIGGVAVTGAQAFDFARSGGPGACVAGGSLAAGGACTLYVTFTPGGAGARSATLNVNAAGQALFVPLSGNGVTGATRLTALGDAAAEPIPALDLSALAALALLLAAVAGAAGRRGR